MKGAAGDDETAQNAFKRLLRDVVAPELRRHGLTGSGAEAGRGRCVQTLRRRRKLESDRPLRNWSQGRTGHGPGALRESGHHRRGLSGGVVRHRGADRRRSADRRRRTANQDRKRGGSGRGGPRCRRSCEGVRSAAVDLPLRFAGRGRDRVSVRFRRALSITGLRCTSGAGSTADPHRERARRCAEAGGAEFLLFGVPVVVVGGIPSDRELRVTATEADYGGRVGPRWAEVRLHLSDAPPVGEHQVGVVGVDYARLMLGDADALGNWQHERPIDGLADVAYWGATAEQARATLGGEALDDSTFGWTDLGVDDALRLGPPGRTVEGRSPDCGTGDGLSSALPPLGRARTGSPLGSRRGRARLAGARLLMFFTSWGDGLYPVIVERSADGVPVAVRVQLGDEERRLRTERVFSGG